MRSFVSLRTQYENLGDEVINGLLVRELARRMPVTALADGVPDWYLRQFKTHIDQGAAVTFETSAARFYTRLALAGAKPQASYLFLSPGDTTSRSEKFNARDFLMRGLARLPGLRLANVGASFSALSAARAKILSSSLKRGGPLTVRDHRSAALAARDGLKLPVVPDLAYLLGRKNSGRADKALISLRAADPASFTGTAVLDLVQIARDAGLEPVITWQVARDRDYCRALAESLGGQFVDFVGARPTLGEVAALYQQCRIVFSNRLHVLLIAAAFGAIALPLIGKAEAKVRGVFEAAALDDLIIDDQDEVGKVGALIDRHNELDVRFHSAFSSAQADLGRFFDGLASPGRQI